MLKVSFWDVMSILLLIATVVVIAVVGILFFNPDSPINPFPYPTMPAPVILPTFTPTPYILPATWTPTPKIMATPNP